ASRGQSAGVSAPNPAGKADGDGGDAQACADAPIGLHGRSLRVVGRSRPITNFAPSFLTSKLEWSPVNSTSIPDFRSGTSEDFGGRTGEGQRGFSRGSAPGLSETTPPGCFRSLEPRGPGIPGRSSR